MKYLFMIFSLSFLFFGCASESQPVQNTQQVSQSNQKSDEVKVVLDEENTYRLGLGQTLLTEGLSCTLYKITGGQYIQNDSTHTPTLTGVTSVASFLFKDSFNQPNSSVNDGLNVLPSALKNNVLYKNLILLRCVGKIVIVRTDWYDFELLSDDGSVLYINGTRLIDNDGGHGITSVSSSKYLRRGVYDFRLDFAQTGSGNQALILNVNGVLVPGSLFFH